MVRIVDGDRKDAERHLGSGEFLQSGAEAGQRRLAIRDLRHVIQRNVPQEVGAAHLGGPERTLLEAFRGADDDTDRKSTRLNSSHLGISYAVFCLKDTATTEIYTLSLHDALPISSPRRWGQRISVARNERSSKHSAAPTTTPNSSLTGIARTRTGTRCPSLWRRKILASRGRPSCMVCASGQAQPHRATWFSSQCIRRLSWQKCPMTSWPR